MLVALAAFWVLALVAVVARWPGPGIWAGTSFLATCSLLGLAAVGAVLRRGRARQASLAAALFGSAYLALTFGQPTFFELAPRLPTEDLVNNFFQSGRKPIFAGFPDFATPPRYRLTDRAILMKLDKPIQIHFSHKAPLDDVLQYIKQATSDDDFPGIPIYVDPVGLQIAEQNLQSTVIIEHEAIPVRDALRLCLKQVGLGFTVRSGFLHITDEESARVPVYEDPVQVVGHSLFALFAAGLGALAARFVSDSVGRTRP